jgi:hypothetical protein
MVSPANSKLFFEPTKPRSFQLYAIDPPLGMLSTNWIQFRSQLLLSTSKIQSFATSVHERQLLASKLDWPLTNRPAGLDLRVTKPAPETSCCHSPVQKHAISCVIQQSNFRTAHCVEQSDHSGLVLCTKNSLLSKNRWNARKMHNKVDSKKNLLNNNPL